MVEEKGAGSHLFVRIPGIKEIPHDHDDVPPTLDILLSPFLFDFEEQFIEHTFLDVLSHVIAGLPVELFEEEIELVLILLNRRQVLHPDAESFEDFRGEDFQLGVENPSLVAEEDRKSKRLNSSHVA